MLTIDFDSSTVRVREAGADREFPLASPEAFAAVSRAWLRCGWDTKYVYSFTWLGRPVIQLPEDLLRIQEVIYSVEPDVIIETGVAHGGSLVFYASLCKALDRGRVIGIDVEIREHNRAALQSHPLSDRIELIEGSSTDPAIVARVRQMVRPGEKVLVLLDSCHAKAHVLAELEAYGPLVTPGSYIVATDGIMQDLVGAPRSEGDWNWNNPRQATREFVEAHREFKIEEPAMPFNEGAITDRVTYWPSAYLKRIA
jgi:cephalosporin hydroxylase